MNLPITVAGHDVTVQGAKTVLTKMFRIQKSREWQRDPSTWLVDRFDGKVTDMKWSAWPGYENHTWDGTKDPLLTAANALANGKDVALESATGVGKSWSAARIAYWFLDVFPNSAVITTAPTKEQLLQVLWKEIGGGFKKFSRSKPNATMITGEVRVTDQQYDDMPGANLDYSNRMVSKVGRKRAGEDSSIPFQGIHHVHQLFILDEAAGIDPAIYIAIINTNTFKGQYVELKDDKGNVYFKGQAINSILALGNPDSVTDALHQFSRRESVVSVRISAYDHPNVVLKRAVIPGAVTVESLEERRREYGAESNLFRSRGRGIAPEQATDALIMRKWFDQCCRYHEAFDEKDATGKSPRDRFKNDPQSFPAVGVDVANSINGDMAALAFGDRNRCKSIQEFQCPNANILADNLVKDSDQLAAEGILDYHTEKLSDYGITQDYIGVDAVGVGVATVNQFEALGLKVNSLQGGADPSAVPQIREDKTKMDSPLKPMYKFANLRAQMYFQFRLDCQSVDFTFDITDLKLLNAVAEELTMVQYKVDNNHIIIEKKIDLKKRNGGKSPNRADAVVYWNWTRKKRHGQFATEMPVGFGDVEIVDDKPILNEEFTTESEPQTGVPDVMAMLNQYYRDVIN